MDPYTTEIPGLNYSTFNFGMNGNSYESGYHTLDSDFPRLSTQYGGIQNGHAPCICEDHAAEGLSLRSPENRAPERIRPNTPAGHSHGPLTTLPNISYHQNLPPFESTTTNTPLRPGMFPAYAGADNHLDFVDDQTPRAHVCKPIKKLSPKYKCLWKGCTSRCEFASEYTLVRHLKTVHISPHIHECPEPACNKSFGRKDKLRTHVKLVHG